jgi:hypothetical protein
MKEFWKRAAQEIGLILVSVITGEISKRVRERIKEKKAESQKPEENEV